MTTVIAVAWVAIIMLIILTANMANDVDVGVPRGCGMPFIVIVVGSVVGCALVFDIYNTVTPWGDGYFAGPFLIVTLVTLAMAAGGFLFTRARVNARMGRYSYRGSRSGASGSDVIGTFVSGIGLIASILGIISFYLQHLR